MFSLEDVSKDVLDGRIDVLRRLNEPELRRELADRMVTFTREYARARAIYSRQAPGNFDGRQALQGAVERALWMLHPPESLAQTPELSRKERRKFEACRNLELGIAAVKYLRAQSRGKNWISSNGRSFAECLLLAQFHVEELYKAWRELAILGAADGAASRHRFRDHLIAFLDFGLYALQHDPLRR